MSRKRFLIQRLLGAIPVLLAIITLSFFTMRAVPGGPFDNNLTLPPEIEQNLRQKYGLEQPLWQQYLRYLGNICKGDLGPSFKYPDRSVQSILWEAAPTSLGLGTLSMLVALLVGTFCGMVGAVNPNSRIDKFSWLASLVGLSLPTILLGPLLVMVFALHFSWLPVAGWPTGWPLSRGDLSLMILPVMTLSTVYAASIARLTRNQIVEVFDRDYIKVARAKGLSEGRLLWRHVLRTALTPTLSFVGPAFASVLSGSIVVEQLFQIPGLGQYFIKAAINRDYTLALGTLMFYSTLLILLNIVVDLLYTSFDPRVRHEA